ncbi:DUF1659 domain-containing protein [Clostridium magnum]|uniref:DUF1659 domain-containing protein n=1 Tax=Clostridium magnum DSM 2767 TaxID=1121326 RepID=A0A162QZ91_9CLOT|nr:DUF1659 domain-containing protein [Clostridium magnum]KZL89181.1 hypothetical protein CLMAG_53990 [Clostridium magnum DSM 2767]SHJ24470.1 Protein of unknown function [Clostridium magnum DSM 2767]
MAAVSTKLSSDLVIVVQTGVDVQGKEVLKKSTIGKLLLTAADQDILDVVLGIEKVLNYSVNEIQKNDHNAITSV